MKHLLIILSILLLSSPVIGDSHKGETLYKWKTSSGEVWKGFGDKETHPVYKGDVKNGVPNGLGFLIFPNTGKYVGEWKDGEFNGQGTYTYVVASELSEFEKLLVEDSYEGRRQLKGEIQRFSGWKYVGEFKDGNFHGQGTKTYLKNYSGYLNDVIRDGQVIITFDGNEYEGGWKDGRYDGQGTFTYPNGGKYVGEWKNGKRNGQGTFTNRYGDKYVGEYKNDEPWNGTGYEKDGNILGKFVNGEYIKQ